MGRRHRGTSTRGGSGGRRFAFRAGRPRAPVSMFGRIRDDSGAVSLPRIRDETRADGRVQST
ncbi:ORF22b [Fowl aviadenovirus E]|uniref:ORF22b n=1 Tax=Fowl aviadenovirus E TaxID=190065 RepID=A0A1D8DDY8_9ADEN|nr:ORF22b [Fowl aviadenovirus E]